jgi:hypothetical protein
MNHALVETNWRWTWDRQVFNQSCALNSTNAIKDSSLGRSISKLFYQGEARHHVRVECINKLADSLIEITGPVCHTSHVVIQTSRSLFKRTILEVLVELPWVSFWYEKHIYFRWQILLNWRTIESSAMFWDQGIWRFIQFNKRIYILQVLVLEQTK